MSAAFKPGDRVRITDDASVYTGAAGKVGTFTGEEFEVAGRVFGVIVGDLDGFGTLSHGPGTQTVLPEHLEATE